MKNQEGFTLLELVLYVVILSVASVVVVNLFITINSGSAQIQVRSEVNSNLRFATEKISQDLRSATSVSTPSTAGATTSNLVMSVAGSNVEYCVAAGQLRRQILGGGPAVFVQSKSKGWFAGAGSTESITFNSAVTGGNMIAVAVAWATPGSTLTSLKDSLNNTYTVIDNRLDGTTGDIVTLYFKNVPAGTTTLTATWSADPGFGVLVAHEVSGLDIAAPLDQHTTQKQSFPTVGTDAISSSNVTTIANGEYIFGSVFNEDGANPGITAGTNYTLREVPQTYGKSEDRIQPTAGIIAATFSMTSTGTFLTAIATFKASAGGVCNSSSSSITTNTVIMNAPSFTRLENTNSVLSKTAVSVDMDLTVTSLDTAGSKKFSSEKRTAIMLKQ